MKSPPPPSDRGRRPEAISELRPAWAAVDLVALVANLARLRRRLAPAAVLAVVKADAYGHGAVEVGRALEDAGAEWLGVGGLAEGAELRAAGVGLPILVMGASEAAEIAAYRRHDLTPTLSSPEQVEAWTADAAAHGPWPVHLKVDTGMSRLGLAPGELEPALAALRRSALELGGVLSHLAEADEPGSRRNLEQERLFRELLVALTPGERETARIHLANSGGALHLPVTRHDLARLGLALYGLDPAGREADLEPVMSVIARVVQVRDVPAGTRVGYGGSWVARRASRLAVVPVGYGDGYSWRLSNRGEALVRGRRVPVAGRVSMDMTLLDVTDVGAESGEETVLLGRQGDEEIGAAELAQRAGTIPWETLCLFGLRLPRRYRRQQAAAP